jgi:hypothetical protein
MAGVTLTDCTIDAPTELIATPFSQTMIGLWWQDRSDNEIGFSVERSPDGISDWQVIGQAPMRERVPGVAGPELLVPVSVSPLKAWRLALPLVVR